MPKDERDAKRCVNQFVKLIKIDCMPALEESNEFYHIKKTNLKANLDRLNNTFTALDHKIKRTARN